MLKDCRMKLEMIEGITFCEDCKREYRTIKYGRICPKCGSPNTYLLTGNECIISEVEAEDDDEAAEN